MPGSSKKNSGRRRQVRGPVAAKKVKEVGETTKKKLAALDRREQMAAVCKLQTLGRRYKEIETELEGQYGAADWIQREKFYPIVREAIAARWLQCHYPADLRLEQEIRQRYPWIRGVEVVDTRSSEEVARAAARALLRMVQQCYRAGKKEEVHIGFAAGNSMRQLAQAFADLLCEPAEHLPKKIFFLAIVTAYEPGSPTTDPNSFFSYFLNRPLKIEPRFVGLHAPTIVHSSHIVRLKKNREIREAFEEANRLDIIATSGSDWNDRHSSLHAFLERRSQESLEAFISAGAIIDLLWQPFGENGPVDVETEFRALTLIELSTLSAFVRSGGQVLLMLGPCGMCNKPKDRVFQAVLDSAEHLVTHVVVDSRTGLLHDGPSEVLHQKSPDDGREQHKEGSGVRSRAESAPRDSIEVDERTLVAAVIRRFMQNKSVEQIRKEVLEEYGPPGEMTREQPGARVRDGAKLGWFWYRPPAHLRYETYIYDHYMGVKRVCVAHTGEFEHVARAAADMLLRLVQQCFRSGKTGEVHIGLDSGIAMQQLAQAFADVLCEPARHLPKKICFHSMVSAFDPGFPTTDARTFFTYFLERPTLQIEPRFVSLHAPTIVTREAIDELRENREIADSFAAVQQLDIVAISGSVWDHEHSSLRSFMARSPRALKHLVDEGIIGDVLWRPIGETGPIKVDTEIRTLTLMELSDLQAFVSRGKHVLFMLGPCGRCNEPRGRLLHAVLNQEQPLISHLVADSRTTGQFIGMMKGGIPERCA